MAIQGQAAEFADAVYSQQVMVEPHTVCDSGLAIIHDAGERQWETPATRGPIIARLGRSLRGGLPGRANATTT